MEQKNRVAPYRSFEYAVAFVQVCAYLSIAPLIRLFFGAKRLLPREWTALRRGTLFVANHQSMLDPFAVLSYIPFSAFLRIVPLYFPVSYRYYPRWYLRPFLKLLGCYNMGGTKKERLVGLMRTRTYLKRGRTVFLFPEGRISRENISTFERGIEFFVQDSAGVVFVKTRDFSVQWNLLAERDRSLVFSEVYSFDRDPIEAAELRNFLESM